MHKRRLYEKKNGSQAQAEKRYKAKTYKTFTVNARIADYEKIETYCSST